MTDNDDSRTTAKERADLERWSRDNAKVAHTRAEQREKELIADAEEQLARQFAADDERWAEVVRQATELVEQLQTSVNEQVSAACTEQGIPREFHPRLVIGTAWLNRGENMSKQRRDELRRVVRTRAAAVRSSADYHIDRQDVEIRGRILNTGLRSEEARQLFESVLTPEALMPKLNVVELERSLPIRVKQEPTRFPYYDHDQDMHERD